MQGTDILKARSFVRIDRIHQFATRQSYNNSSRSSEDSWQKQLILFSFTANQNLDGWHRSYQNFFPGLEPPTLDSWSPHSEKFPGWGHYRQRNNVMCCWCLSEDPARLKIHSCKETKNVKNEKVFVFDALMMDYDLGPYFINCHSTTTSQMLLSRDLRRHTS